MGKGSSKSKTDQSTRITETTNVDVGDVGITAQDAAAFAAVLNNSYIAQSESTAKLVGNIATLLLPEEQRKAIAANAGGGVGVADTGNDALDPILLAVIAGSAYFTIKALGK